MHTTLGPTAHRRWATLIAPTMFVLSLAFLAGLAILVVYVVDVPGLRERNAAGDSGTSDAGAAGHAVTASVPMSLWMVQIFLLAIWPLFWIESLMLWLARPTRRIERAVSVRWLLCAACPPLRLCARHVDVGDAIWFPYWGWRVPDERLRKSLVHVFGIPMLVIAMLILPVLGIELLMKDQVARYPSLRTGLHFSTGLIWFAFTVEFIVMISVAERKIAYCKQHWIDLAIILLPLISFLRSLQMMRATRLARFAKVPQMTKLARAYRLRGVTAKALRAFVLLDVAARLMRTSPEKRIAHLRREHARLSLELEEIERRIEALQSQCAASS